MRKYLSRMCGSAHSNRQQVFCCKVSGRGRDYSAMLKRSFFLCAGILAAVLAAAQSPSTSGEFQALKQKAEAGDAQAQTELGITYRDRDPSQAAEWFRKAAAQ